MATGSTAENKKATPATGQSAPAAKLPADAGKIVGAEARRLAHAADPRNLKTLALLDAGNFEAPAIARAIGHDPGDVEAHLDTLRREELVGVEKAGGARAWHITDEGRRLWDAAKAVAAG